MNSNVYEIIAVFDAVVAVAFAVATRYSQKKKAISIEETATLIVPYLDSKITKLEAQLEVVTVKLDKINGHVENMTAKLKKTGVLD